MQDSTFRKIDNWSAVVGALAFGAFLVLDLARDGSAPVIVFEAAMTAFCLGHAIPILPVVDELNGVVVKACTNTLVGLSLATSFTFFAIQSVNTAQLLFAAAVVAGGIGLHVTGLKRMRDVHRAIKQVTGDRR